MKRRITSLMLVLVMIFTLLPVQVFAADPAEPFRDVKKGDWCYDAVRYVNANGIFYGNKALFNPQDTMTRGMFVTVLGRMAGVDMEKYRGVPSFSDVPEGAYYAPYVAWAAKYGIAGGYADGTFAPYAPVSRQQMATFFVRYFEAFGVDYTTGQNITTTPADIDSVSAYARDAVLKLWRTGLFVGNGGNFMPRGNATRAHAATICYRADQTVKTWYTEPGVASTRVRINPATGLPYDNDSGNQPANPSGPAHGNGGGSGGSGGGGGGTTTTTYYEVRFALGSGVDATGVTLPSTATYAANTPVTSLPTPTVQNRTFLGWYYDAAMTQSVASGDKVTRNMTLYARIGTSGSDSERAALTVRDEPNYITNADAPTDFVLKLSGSYQPGEMTITDVTLGNAQVEFTVTNGTVGITGVEGDDNNFKQLTTWEAGHTYKVELSETSEAVFDYDGPQDPSVRVFNIITKKAPVNNLRVDEGMVFIPRGRVSNLSGTMEGLFTLSVDESGQSRTQENYHTGSFTYTGNDLNVGDTAAIFEGKDPRERGLADIDGNIVYATVTEKSGDTYTYRTADAENVLFTPDILPVSNTEDKVTDDGNTLTVDAGVFDFRDGTLADMGLDAATTVDAGDFVALYDGANAEDATSVTYGEIDTVRLDVLDNADVYVITYIPVSEDDVLASMDLYHTENREIQLTDAEIQGIKRDMVTQATESGFIDEAAEYLTALALETDGFQELADGFDLESFTMTYADGTPVNRQDLSLVSYAPGRAGNRVNITKKEITPKVSIGKLDHFDGRGVTAELEMTLEIEVGIGGGNKIQITLQAAFEQEILLNFTKSGGAVWKTKWKIFPYIADYQMTANIDLGTYTGIGITATAKTAGEEDEGFDWKNTSGTNAEQKILDIGKQITALMDQKDKFLNYDLVGGDDGDDDGGIPIDGGLPEKYAAMIDDAEDSWIEIFRVKIFEQAGAVDPLHILAYQVGAHFVVSANLYVTVGMTFDYAVAKRYSFSLSLFSRRCTNNVVDLETAHYEFMFYAMGTMGIRAGVEFEIAIGLFSTKLDSIGICAEAGAYAQMWGYFYYQLKWEQGSGKESNYSGAMFIDIGAYLKISFKAQVFSCEKLTWKPTIYEHEWPIYSVGEQENVLDFFLEEDADDLNIEMIAETSTTLPTSVLTMKYLDMKSGKLGGEEDDNGRLVPGKIFDDKTESRFKIELSNSENFSYDPETNTINVTPNGKGTAETDMTITWLGCKLSFHSEPIRRTVHISWVSPTAQYIVFNTAGGSRVRSLIGEVGEALTWPAADPVKTGYHFGGWYTDEARTQAFAPVSSMPAFTGGSMGLTLYAKWLPNTDTAYTIENYRQQTNGAYTLIDREDMTGTTDAVITITPKTDGDYGRHFTPVYDTTTTIAPDGSTVLRVNYDRNIYTHTFTYGDYAAGNEPVVYEIPYEGTVYAPVLALPGYTFNAFSGYTVNPETGGMASMGNSTYIASWTPRTDIPYRVAHYIQRVADAGGYLLSGDEAVQNFYGATGSTITPVPLSDPGLTYTGTVKVNGQTVANPTIAADGSTIVELYYDRNAFNVTWNANGGALEDPGATPSRVVYGARLSAPAVANGKHELLGWFTDAECTVPMPELMPAEDLTLYAKWGDVVLGEGEYPITYAGLEGVTGYPGSGYPTYYTAESAEITLPTPSRAGYTFAGWTGTDLTGPTMTVTIPTGSTGERSYTATWEAEEYTITYMVGGNELTGLTPAGYGAADTASSGFALADPAGVKGEDHTAEGGTAGKIIDGWYASADCSGEKITAVPQGSAENLTYYGQWKQAPIPVVYHVMGDSSFATKADLEALFPAGTELPDTLEAGTQLPTTMRDEYQYFYWCLESSDTENLSYSTVRGYNESGQMTDGLVSRSPSGQIHDDGYVHLYLMYAPKEIRTPTDLMRLGYAGIRSKDDGKYLYLRGEFILMNDITLTANEESAWITVPGFTGTFNGQGHTITYDDTVTGATPLFGEVQGTVENLKIQFSGTVGPLWARGDLNSGLCHDNYMSWGAIASQTKANGKILNCAVTGGRVEGGNIMRMTGIVVGNGSLTYTENTDVMCTGPVTVLTGNGTVYASDGVTVTLNGNAVTTTAPAAAANRALVPPAADAAPAPEPSPTPTPESTSEPKSGEEETETGKDGEET